MAQTKVKEGLIDATLGGGVSWDSTVKTSAFTAVAGEGYFVNTTSAAITVTLPSSPSAGDEVTIVDYAGTADTNAITITSSNNIKGSASDFRINYERGAVSMVYVDATQGWVAYNAANETANALIIPSFSVDYLVVAGGGGGAGTGGAGGAGGLRTSYGSSSGGGASAETQLSLDVGIDYTVTVGSGGTGGNYPSDGSNGSNSVFSTITSIGGGAGDHSGNGAAGGSGGGAGYGGTGGAGTSSQGFAGGNGYNSSPYSGGGGGGAAAVGTNGTSSAGGNGGAGLAVNIISSSNATSLSVGEVSGSDVYFAGGGGGAIRLSSAAGGDGGIGGGGDNGNPAGSAGTANTGGGGGSGTTVTSGAASGADGGSGVVIVRYPNTRTLTIGSGLTGSTVTEGSDKVSVFTAGTGTISFS